MPVYKDKVKGTWYSSFYYKDWKGEQVRKLKRGFKTKKDAQEWECMFKQQKAADLSMTFESFIEIYLNDVKDRIRMNTLITKKHIIYKKLLPYFRNKKMNEIRPSDIIQWQNEMISFKGDKNRPYADTYIRTLHNQLSTIFNHAIRYYELKSNPVFKAGSIGKKQSKEMLFWTKDEYLKFADSMMDKHISYCAFEILYWCGLRIGEMLALTPSDFNFDNNTVCISKSYQRINREDVITDPKTVKSNRVINMPDFLSEEIQEYISMLYGSEENTRIFPITKSYMHHEMDRGCKETGVKRIRIHDLRHSHVSLLIEMGFSAIAIADRVGHESIEITYRYAHLFPAKQIEIAEKLNLERSL